MSLTDRSVKLAPEVESFEVATSPINEPNRSFLRGRPSLVPQKGIGEQILSAFTPKRLAMVVICALLSVLCETCWHPPLTVNGKVTEEAERWKPYFVMATILLAILLITDDLPADGVLLALSVLYIFTGIITEEAAFKGFGNSGVVAYAGLFAISQAFQEVRVLNPILERILGNSQSPTIALLRLVVPVCVLSAIFNNGPVVAMVVPVVENWAQRAGHPASLFLMPLAYASTLGGTLTVIGSAANLVASANARELKPPVTIAFFDLTLVGAISSVAGILYILIMARYLLPNRSSTHDNSSQVLEDSEAIEEPSTSAYEIEFDVGEGCVLANRTMLDTGIKNTPGVMVRGIIRDDNLIVASALNPDDLLLANDTLRVSATPAGVQALRAGFNGLLPKMKDELDRLGAQRRKRKMVEAVVGQSSSLKDAPFNAQRFIEDAGAVILAVRRAGWPGAREAALPSSYDKFDIREGDVILFEAFIDKFNKQKHEFSLVSIVNDTKPPRRGNLQDEMRAVFCLGGLLVMVVLTALDIVQLTPTVLALVLACCIGKVYDWQEARQSVNGGVMITIACAFALSAAMKSSGAAEAIASLVVNVGLRAGSFGVLCAVYVATAMLSNIISNTATAVMMLPIAAEVASRVGEDVKGFVLLIIFAANAAFSTPIATPCNMLVVDAGAYRFGDFLKFGLPLQILLTFVTCGAVKLLS
mmetsp:Transcript_21080/g.33987  ORF Transcript_21080/g.33987 Transcript_21080/m.33987 type:complete len:702 (-) Transcript_21080:93-2198(-)